MAVIPGTAYERKNRVRGALAGRISWDSPDPTPPLHAELIRPSYAVPCLVGFGVYPRTGVRSPRGLLFLTALHAPGGLFSNAFVPEEIASSMVWVLYVMHLHTSLLPDDLYFHVCFSYAENSFQSHAPLFFLILTMQSFVLKAWPLLLFCGSQVSSVTEQVTPRLSLGHPVLNPSSEHLKADWKASGLQYSLCTGVFGFIQPPCLQFLLLCIDLLQDARKWRCLDSREGRNHLMAHTFVVDTDLLR